MTSLLSVRPAAVTLGALSLGAIAAALLYRRASASSPALREPVIRRDPFAPDPALQLPPLLPPSSSARGSSSSTRGGGGSSTAGIPSHPVEVLDRAPAAAVHATATTIPTSTARARGLPSPPFAPSSSSTASPLPLISEAPHPISPPGGVDEAGPARAPRVAARELLNLVSPLIRAGRLAELGTKEAPSDEIANLQRDMRGLKSDGIYGPKTQARGKELLGIEFPSRSGSKRRAQAQPLPAAPPAPASLATLEVQRAPQEAAHALYELVTTPPVHWGSTESPNADIRRAQQDMGRIAADGIYGPKTQARAAALLRQSFPARSKGVS
jgi:hypothetical protein